MDYQQSAILAQELACAIDQAIRSNQLSPEDQRRRDRFEAAKDFASALISDGHTMWESPSFQGSPERIAEFAWDMADKFMDMENKEA